MSERIPLLVVEDDREISRFISSSLSAAGYFPYVAACLADARKLFREVRPALVILDLGLPDGDGKAWLSELRERSDAPVLVLSARQSEREKVVCLDCGADDYLSKPFGADEMLARVRAALRRAAMMRMRDHVYEVDGLRIDSVAGTVVLDGEPVKLTPIEHKLLMLLARHSGKVVTYRQLLASVWGPEYVDETHYLRIHMGRLRAKIEAVPAEPRFLLTDPGIGYRIAAS
ncbi:MAG: winged helix-turn-helix domain-containing protein [Burkholderiales bacterium]